jgi:Bacterial transcriptional regulator
VRVVGRQDVTQQGRLGCERLAAKLGETVNITCGARISAVSVEKARGPSAVDTHNRVGELSRLHATSSGQILPAYLRPEQRREVLGTCGLKRLTARTITSLDALNIHLKKAARDGYARAVEEFGEDARRSALRCERTPERSSRRSASPVPPTDLTGCSSAGSPRRWCTPPRSATGGIWTEVTEPMPSVGQLGSQPVVEFTDVMFAGHQHAAVAVHA